MNRRHIERIAILVAAVVVAVFLILTLSAVCLRDRDLLIQVLRIDGFALVGLIAILRKTARGR